MGITILVLSPFQGLVAAFVGAQQMLNSKISSLQEDILEHKQHINKLKKEFNEAYKREYDSEVCKSLGGGQTGIETPKMFCTFNLTTISNDLSNLIFWKFMFYFPQVDMKLLSTVSPQKPYEFKPLL